MPSPAGTPTRSERAIQDQVLRLLRARGVLAWKIGSGAFRSTYKGRERFVRMGVKGMADIIGVRGDGRFLAIEMKRPGQKPTAHQVAFLESVTRAGGTAFVATSCADVMREMRW